LPFDLTNSGGCNAFGTANVSNVYGGLQIDIQGGSLTAQTPACVLQVQVKDFDLSFHVPDVGDAVTPVFWFLSQSSSLTGGVELQSVNFVDVENYGSAALGATVEGVEFPGSGRVSEAEPDSFVGPVFYIPGDDVAYVASSNQQFEIQSEWFNDTVSGTLNTTIRLEAVLPPSASFAAFPAPAFTPFGRALLVAAILGGAGWTLVRRRV